METIILAVKPGEVSAGGTWGRTLAHLAYRMGEGPHLFRANSPVAPRGGLMVIEDTGFQGLGEAEPFCNEVLRECAARRFQGVVCRFLGKPRAILNQIVLHLGETCSRRGLSLYVTESCAGTGAGRVLISTALSGGTLRGRLEAAAERYGRERVCLWMERTAEDFLLPSPSGAGAPLTVEELNRRREERGASVFFSPELCAHYFTYMAGEKGHFVLFDDAGSMSRKLAQAGQLGISTAFLPYTANAALLGALLGESKK